MPNKKNYKQFKWLLYSQSLIAFGVGIVFPFYILFVRELGADFSQAGIAFALFSLSSAFFHMYIGKLSDTFGRNIFLLINSWGTAVILLLLPIVTQIWQVYVLQIILGVLNALYKTSEKTLVADVTNPQMRGKEVGRYHSWIAFASALAVVVGGYLIDLFTLSVIFYVGAVILFLSGFAVLKVHADPKQNYEK